MGLIQPHVWRPVLLVFDIISPHSDVDLIDISKKRLYKSIEKN